MLVTSLLDVQINVTVVITQTLKTAFRATRQAGLTRSQPVRPYSKRLVTSENHCLINIYTYNYVLLVIYNLLVIYFYCPPFLWKITLYVLTAHAHTHQCLKVYYFRKVTCIKFCMFKFCMFFLTAN